MIAFSSILFVVLVWLDLDIIQNIFLKIDSTKK